MAKWETHIEDCMRLLGAPFVFVHAYLDYYTDKYPTHIYLEYHRKFRHNKEGVEKCLELFGPLGEKAAKIHLIRDVELYVCKPKMFDEIMGEDIDEYYEKCLQYFPPINEPLEKYIKMDKVELAKLNL
jgi:hypothetical protein